jgi:hypothetical protein
MDRGPDAYRMGRVATNLEEIDLEVARLAQLCGLRLLQRGVVERVLHRDASVCGTDNRIAFGKLQALLMLHFAVRERSAQAFGQSRTAAIESYVVDRLGRRFPELAADWPPRGGVS